VGVEEIVLALGFRHDLVRTNSIACNGRPAGSRVNPQFELRQRADVHARRRRDDPRRRLLLMDADVLYDARIPEPSLRAGGQSAADRRNLKRAMGLSSVRARRCADRISQILGSGLHSTPSANRVDSSARGGWWRALAQLVAGYAARGQGHLPHEERADLLLERSQVVEVADVRVRLDEIDFRDVIRATEEILPLLNRASGAASGSRRPSGWSRLQRGISTMDWTICANPAGLASLAGRAPVCERVLNLLRQTRPASGQEDARGDRHAADPDFASSRATGNVMPAMPALVAE